MRFLTTVILVFVLLAVGGYILLIRGTDDAGPGVELDDRLLPGYRAIEVNELNVENEHGTFRFNRTADGGWRLVSPVQARADLGAVAGILSPLEFVAFSRELSSELPEYGLDEPRARLEATSGNPASSLTLAIGNEDALGQNVWVRITGGSRPGVFVVKKEILDPLVRDLPGFRNRDLLTLRSWDVHRIAITSEGSRILATRQGSSWLIEEPFVARGDLNKIREMLNALVAAKVRQFVAEGDADRTPYGLDPPRHTVVLEGGGSRPRTETLHLGSVNREGLLHARLGEDPTVVAIDDEILVWVRIPVNELRDLQVFPTFGVEISEITIGEGESGFSLVRDETGSAAPVPDGARDADDEPEDPFWIVQGDRKHAADPDEVDRARALVRDLRAKEFVSGPEADDPGALGLDPPRRRVSFRSPDVDRPLLLKIGAPREEGGLVPVMNGTESAVFLVEADGLAAAFTEPFRFRARQVLDVAFSRIVRFEVRTGAHAAGYELTGPASDRTWQGALEGEEPVPVNRTETLLFFEKLLPLTAEEFLADDAARLQAFGLDDPDLVLHLVAESQGEEGDEQGDETEEETEPAVEEWTIRFARTDGDGPESGEASRFAVLEGTGLVFRVARDLAAEAASFLERTVLENDKPEEGAAAAEDPDDGGDEGP